MEDLVLPGTADALVDLLNAHFPEPQFNPSMSVQDIWFKAGQREVVRFLNELRRRRDESVLETTHVLHA